MALQTIEINSVKITFDKEETQKYRPGIGTPCGCQYCRNYYKNIENNTELVEFLSDFGVDVYSDDEIFSWDLGDSSDSLIHCQAYYGVFGKIEDRDFSFKNFGVKITFSKDASVPSYRTGEYFWICVEADLPYILDEQREMPIAVSLKEKIRSFFESLRAVFKT